MKTKNLYLAVVMLGIITWSCNKTNESASSTNPVSLKSSINTGVLNLSSAVNAISTSQGYKVFTGANDLSTKSAVISPLDTLTQTIGLADIAGIYTYKATKMKRGQMSLMKFFTKTGTSSQMIVSLPESKVKSPRTLLRYTPADTLLANDYSVTVSDYLVKFNLFNSYDYKLASSIKIKDVDAGALQIQSTYGKNNGYQYSSEFDFPDGYSTKYLATSGDTAVSSYSINQGTKTLYQEKLTSIKTSTDLRRRERDYSLTIGNVLIERKLGIGQTLDSAKVYVSGVLQLKSKVEIIDTSTDPTVDPTITNQKRELKITFDDGTSSTFSQLAGTVITNIYSIFTSMQQVNFATNIVDMIAWDIYTKKN